MGKNRIFFARWTPAIYWSLVSKPVSQDIQSICYCLHTGIFCLDTCDLVVAGVRISISPKYLYLYLYLELSGSTADPGNQGGLGPYSIKLSKEKNGSWERLHRFRFSGSPYLVNEPATRVSIQKLRNLSVKSLATLQRKFKS